MGRMPQSVGQSNDDLVEINKRLATSVAEQQRIAQMVVQKDLELSRVNDLLNRQVNQLQVLQSVGDEIKLIIDKDKALSLIAHALVTDLYFSAVVILLGVPPFKIGVTYGYKTIDADAVRQHKLSTYAYTSGAVYIVRDVKDSSKEDQELGALLHLTSYCIFPLYVRNTPHGMLLCGFNDPYQKLQNVDIEFLHIVANSIGTTLESFKIAERERRVDALKSEFVSIASHQLRTPLSVIKWILKMIVDGDLGKNLNEEQFNFLQKAYQSNERMIALVNDLLNVARIEEGRLEYNFTSFVVTDLIKEVVDQYALAAEQKDVHCSFDASNLSVCTMNADREKFSLALGNLVDNAIKFTPKRGQIKVSFRKKRDQECEIRVSDTGIGIEPEDRERLFTKFFRGENAKRTQTEGNGLGLFIVRNIIEEHNGTIAVLSEPGHGTVFTITMPCNSGV